MTSSGLHVSATYLSKPRANLCKIPAEMTTSLIKKYTILRSDASVDWKSFVTPKKTSVTSDDDMASP